MSRNFSRRSFLAGLAAAPLATRARLRAATTGLPSPGKSGISHVVVVMMENRSFDHFFGWLPNANGEQAGLSYPNTSGQMVSTFHLTHYQNCWGADPDHSYAGGRTEYDNGACDGWLLANTHDNFSIGYYLQSDLAFLGSAAPQWTVCDNYFAAIMSSTYPNRIYQHAAQTDRITNTTTISTLPTIWDNLDNAGYSGRYYFSDVPFLALWGTKYASIARPSAEFLTDCASGNLAEVSYIDPRFEDEATGTSADDHPHADIRNGETFLNQIYTAVTTGPKWNSTLLIINFDEWGGFFDHVPPPTAPIPPADQAAGNLDGRLGFRVPVVLVSPWSYGGVVNHTQFDHTSVLKLIEWRFGLPALTVRDSTANNLALALNFSSSMKTPPQYSVPTGPFAGACPTDVTEDLPVDPDDEDLEWAPLLALAQQYGFPVD